MHSYWDIAFQSSLKLGGYVININNVKIDFRVALNRI